MNAAAMCSSTTIDKARMKFWCQPSNAFTGAGLPEVTTGSGATNKPRDTPAARRGEQRAAQRCQQYQKTSGIKQPTEC
jgi:hypothetical protein